MISVDRYRDEDYLYCFSKPGYMYHLLKKTRQAIGFVLFFTPLILIGQVDYDKVPDPSNCYYLSGGIIHESATKTPYVGNITIRNGIIEKIDRSHKAPFDATVITLDSSHVYPGFIDMLSHAGVKTPEVNKDLKAKFPGMPPDELAGITPYRRSKDAYDPKSGQLAKLRAAGFTTVHAALEGGMLTGETMLINTAGTDAYLVSDTEHMYAQFKGAGQYYPSTIIAVIAKWKDLVKQARQDKTYLNSYRAASSGMERPEISKSSEALFDVADKKQRVFFKTHKMLNVYRAISLRNELDLDMVLTHVPEVHAMADKIASENIGLALALQIVDTTKYTVDSSRLEMDEEYSALLRAQRSSMNMDAKNAAILAEKNISFGFSTEGNDPSKAQEIILQMIDNGLSKEEAFDALTMQAARLLHIDKVTGSLQNGKLGQLVVFDKEYFSEKASLEYAITGGQLFELETKKESSSSEATVDIAGTWSYEIGTPDQVRKGTIIFNEASKGVYDVEIISEGGNSEKLSAINLNGDAMSFDYEYTEDGFTMEIGFDIKFEEEKFKGNVAAGEFGSFPVDGSLLKKPE